MLRLGMPPTGGKVDRLEFIGNGQMPVTRSGWVSIVYLAVMEKPALSPAEGTRRNNRPTNEQDVG